MLYKDKESIFMPIVQFFFEVLYIVMLVNFELLFILSSL